MKIIRESLFDRIRNRMAPRHAVKIITDLQRQAFREEIAYMAAKEASELVAHYRREARLAIRAFRLWENRSTVRAVLAPTIEHEGRVLKGDARAKAALYIDAMRDYRDLIALSIAHYEAKNPYGEKAND